jgi:sporulation protein YlmC with PRC-barrel domain
MTRETPFALNKNENMKQKLKMITNVSAVSLLALAALGQESLTQPIGQTNYIQQSLIQTSSERLSGAAKASDVIGMTVNNYQDEKLGKVSDLAVDVESGRIVQVIISSGGFLGMGTTLTAVPPGALHQDAELKILQLNSSKEKFNAAPRFDTAKWEECTQSNRVTEVYGYYGEQPYFTAGQNGYSMTNRDGTFASTLPRNMDGTINTAAARPMDVAHNAEIAKTWRGTNFETETATRNPDGTWNHNYSSDLNGSRSAWAKLGYVQKASKLIGTSVKNLQGENLGKVENFTVNLAAGRIVAVIVSSGGFMGMDNELSAVPPTALRFDAQHDALQLDASKESLASSPHFRASEWPDLNQPDYVGGVYRAYNVEPYFTTDATNSVDNTRLNVRDRDSRTLTPLDQGNSQADVDTTAQIRQEIMADAGMTTNAKNVKIITLNGHVTLRGPVNTADEKDRIAAIADRIASAGNVDNQLDVATTPSSN